MNHHALDGPCNNDTIENTLNWEFKLTVIYAEMKKITSFNF